MKTTQVRIPTPKDILLLAIHTRIDWGVLWGGLVAYNNNNVHDIYNSLSRVSTVVAIMNRESKAMRIYNWQNPALQDLLIDTINKHLIGRDLATVLVFMLTCAPPDIQLRIMQIREGLQEDYAWLFQS